MFESKTERLLPRPAFNARLARRFLIALVIVAFTETFVGSLGYHFHGNLPWVDALLNGRSQSNAM